MAFDHCEDNLTVSIQNGLVGRLSIDQNDKLSTMSIRYATYAEQRDVLRYDHQRVSGPDQSGGGECDTLRDADLFDRSGEIAESGDHQGPGGEFALLTARSWSEGLERKGKLIGRFGREESWKYERELTISRQAPKRTRSSVRPDDPRVFCKRRGGY